MPGTELRLPCGARVRAAASYHRREMDPERGFGLYLDPHWNPTWPALEIEWENLGLPLDFEDAARKIECAWERARQGDLVEIGCQAGLGRTGTAIACMAFLSGVEPVEAVPWVRANLALRAVETRLQEWWVLWFGAHLRGEEPPPRP
jgi:hypothetical protein